MRIAYSDEGKDERKAFAETQKEEPDKPSVQPHLRVAVADMPTVNYSLIHAGLPIRPEVTVCNEGEAPVTNVEVQLFLSGYATSELVCIPFIPAKGYHTVTPTPQFRFNPLQLRNLPEPERVLLEVTVNGEKTPLSRPVEAHILPPNAWHGVGHETALAGFVMPNNDIVDEITSRATWHLRRLGLQSFAHAIESPDPQAAEKTLQALYFCLQERYAMTYEYEPRTYAPEWQEVRFPHEVLEKLKGTCIDLALLFAACLENVHRDPLIILSKIGRDPMTGTAIQHALIGCWRDGTLVSDAVIDDEQQVRQWVASGDILVLDSKGFPRTEDFPEGMPFAHCQVEGIRYLRNFPLCYALNIVAVRVAGVTPMPFGKGLQYERSAWLAVFQARREAEARQSVGVGARHLLLGLLSLDNGLMRQVLAWFGEEVVEKVVAVASCSLPRRDTPQRIVSETGDWQAVIRGAEQAAARSGTQIVTEADLAMTLLETPSRVDDVLSRVGLTREQCREVLCELLGRDPMPSDWV